MGIMVKRRREGGGGQYEDVGDKGGNLDKEVVGLEERRMRSNRHELVS